MNIGDLRVWWIPQMPMKAFRVDVPSVEAGVLLMNTLAEYDKFQYENRIKPDYCNAGGLEIFDIDGEWTDWYHESTDGYWDDPAEYLRRNAHEASAQGGKSDG